MASREFCSHDEHVIYWEKLIQFTKERLWPSYLNISIVFPASSTCSFIYTCAYGFNSTLLEERCSFKYPGLRDYYISLCSSFMTVHKQLIFRIHLSPSYLLQCLWLSGCPFPCCQSMELIMSSMLRDDRYWPNMSALLSSLMDRE